MEYKRLNQNITILNMHNHSFRSVKQLTNGEKTENQVIDEIVHDTIEILDKIEQGTLIELPCKVGDTVYKIMHVCGHRRIVQFEVSRISIYEKDICVFFHKSKESWHEWCTKPHHFGCNIFLTREEAEKRLKELQDG